MGAEAIRVARSILSQPAFAAFDGGELSPGPDVASDEQVLDWVRRDRAIRSTPRARAGWARIRCPVVDPLTMRVRDVEGSGGRRLGDAYVTSGNIYAPVMMLARKRPT